MLNNQRVKRKFNPSLNICGAFSLCTSNEIKAILDDLQGILVIKCLKHILKSVKVEEAAGRGKPVVYYAPIAIRH